MADEYDAAQKGGEVASANEGRPRRSNTERLPSAADIGLTSKQVHLARKVRDAEKAKPGIIRTDARHPRPAAAAAVRALFAGKPPPPDRPSDVVVWRDSVVAPSREKGGSGRGKKGKRITEQQSVLPDADPGSEHSGRPESVG